MTERVERSGLVRAVGGLSLLACVGAGFAMFREMALATAYGAGSAVDAYLVALTVPLLLSTSIISTLEAAFIPLYIACKHDSDPDRVNRFANATHLWLLAGGSVLAIAVCVAVPFITPLQAPGFGAEQVAVARRLAWWTAPSVLFASLYAVGRSVLNAEGRFWAPAIAPAVSAGVMILVIRFGSSNLGISAAAIGYTTGTLAMWLTVFIPLTALRLPGRGLTAGWRNPDALRLLGTTRPLLAGVIAMSAIPIVDRFMASRFPEGVISALGYADRVVQIPIAVVAAAVATATFPTLSRDAASQDMDGLRRTLGSGMRLVAVILVPAAILLAMLSSDIVRILFERGEFSAAAAHATTVAVTGLALGMVFMGTLQLVPRVFNALQLASFVALSGCLNLGLKTAFNLLLVPMLGYVGFAVATSAMYVGTGSIMLFLLGRRLNGLHLRALLPSVVAIGIAGGLMVLTVSGVSRVLEGSLSRIAVAGGAASLVYIVAVWLVERRFGGPAAFAPLALPPSREALRRTAVASAEAGRRASPELATGIASGGGKGPPYSL